jgi:hypothetical protein
LAACIFPVPNFDDIMNSAVQLPRKRPPVTGHPTLVRLQPAQLAALDSWIKAQGAPRLSRPQAIRMLLDLALSGRPKRRSSPR